MTDSTPTPAQIRAAFDDSDSLTVGIEEELMLLDAGTLDLVPRAPEVVRELGVHRRPDGEPRFKLELPASQLEIATSAHRDVGEAIRELAQSRAILSDELPEELRVGASGTHPFAEAEGELNPGHRYEWAEREYGRIAREQLVFALQVHVAPGSAELALPVYNALRADLPAIAALAANAPFHRGVDSEFASVRPKISEGLPRQGVPPPIESFEAYAEALEWARVAGSTVDAGGWWWELRPHPRFGTLEIRVPDAQTTIAEAAAIAATCVCLVAARSAAAERGELPPPALDWKIAENRWKAARWGLDASFADLATGEQRPARAHLEKLLGELRPFASRLGCEGELAGALGMVTANGAVHQRHRAEALGMRGLVGWVADRFLEGCSNGVHSRADVPA